MRAGDWSESENQRDQRGPGGERVGEQRDRDVAARQSLAHDSRTNHSGEQEAVPINSDTARRSRFRDDGIGATFDDADAPGVNC